MGVGRGEGDNDRLSTGRSNIGAMHLHSGLVAMQPAETDQTQALQAVNPALQDKTNFVLKDGTRP